MHIKISQEVAEATAVVALESTVYSFLGLPPVQRRQALEQSKEAIRKKGVVPAVTACFEGIMQVGITADQEEQILTSDTAKKMSLRDIPVEAARACPLGVTTVSATMALAAKAGIKVMATGGIGGVHRGPPYADVSADVSADLYALSRYPVGVVCAGAKGFLDLPQTLEVLETFGVPVVGYGTDTFPAFWVASSGLEVSARVKNPTEAGQIIANLSESGAVIGVPVPESEALGHAYIEKVIGSALKKAKKAGVKGAAATPYILAEIASQSEGKSLSANLALLRQNASVAAEIAASL